MSFGEDILDHAAIANLEVVGAGAALFVCDLDLLVLAVGYEPVVVNEPLDGVWEQGSG